METSSPQNDNHKVKHTFRFPFRINSINTCLYNESFQLITWRYDSKAQVLFLSNKNKQKSFITPQMYVKIRANLTHLAGMCNR